MQEWITFSVAMNGLVESAYVLGVFGSMGLVTLVRALRRRVQLVRDAR